MLNNTIPKKYMILVPLSIFFLIFIIISMTILYINKIETKERNAQISKNRALLESTITQTNKPIDLQNDPDGQYTKDAIGRIYYGNSKIEDADPQTFSILTSPKNPAPNSMGFRAGAYAKDKNHIYKFGEILHMDPEGSPQPDLSTFTIIGFAYAKDKAHVYNIEKYYNGDVRIVKEGDLETFKEIFSQYSGNNPGYAYAKDKSHVYLYDSIIQEVDSETFEFIATGSCNYETTECWPRITKDKNCIYHNDEKVLGLDDQCVSPIQCTKATINASCGIN